VTVANKPLDDAGRYKLATNDYLLKGGNGYAMLKDGKVLLDELGGQYVAGQVIGFIQNRGKVSPKTEGRLVIAR
jgi:2',3'-cyclic-nucleotide 2'-phosphodiesterase (5'-nucleotidase family)